MADDNNIIEKNEERYPRFNGFGEMLFWSYANLQMLVAARNMGKAKYDRACYAVRAKAFKAYKEGRWNIHDLFENNIAKMKSDSFCWYCGNEFVPELSGLERILLSPDLKSQLKQRLR